MDGNAPGKDDRIERPKMWRPKEEAREDVRECWPSAWSRGTVEAEEDEARRRGWTAEVAEAEDDGGGDEDGDDVEESDDRDCRE